MNRSLVVMLTTVVLLACLAPLLAEQPPSAQASFTVARSVVGTGIDKGEPSGVAETFAAATEKLYCFLEAKDIPADTQATFVWYNAGKEIHRYSLPLKKGPAWHTWAECRLMGRTGEWKAEIQDAGGNSVKTVTFTVQ